VWSITKNVAEAEIINSSGKRVILNSGTQMGGTVNVKQKRHRDRQNFIEKSLYDLRFTDYCVDIPVFLDPGVRMKRRIVLSNFVNSKSGETFDADTVDDVTFSLFVNNKELESNSIRP
jgi:hypothetical protein